MTKDDLRIVDRGSIPPPPRPPARSKDVKASQATSWSPNRVRSQPFDQRLSDMIAAAEAGQAPTRGMYSFTLRKMSAEDALILLKHVAAAARFGGAHRAEATTLLGELTTFSAAGGSRVRDAARTARKALLDSDDTAATRAKSGGTHS